MKKVTLTKSLIASKPNQRATAQSLGLKKIGDYIVHAHIANPTGRVMPEAGDNAGYEVFFDNLKKAGYNARLSLEGRIQGDFEPTMRAAYAEMKKYMW